MEHPELEPGFPQEPQEQASCADGMAESFFPYVRSLQTTKAWLVESHRNSPLPPTATMFGRHTARNIIFCPWRRWLILPGVGRPDPKAGRHTPQIRQSAIDASGSPGLSIQQGLPVALWFGVPPSLHGFGLRASFPSPRAFTGARSFAFGGWLLKQPPGGPLLRDACKLLGGEMK